MLADADLRLLTAAVDGELAPAEAEALARLLETSVEAKAALARLEADAERIRNLPRLAPPADLRTRVMAKIAAQTPGPLAVPAPRPTPVLAPRLPARRPSWIPLAVAAGLLLAVSAGSFAFFARQNDRAGGFAKAATVKGKGTAPASGTWADFLPPDQAPLPSTPVPTTKPENTVARADASPARPTAPDSLDVPPRPVNREPVLTAPPVAPTPPLDLVQVRLPFLATVADLERDDTKQRLADELGKDPACRIDLFTKDPARAAEVFQAAARAAGLHLLTDAGAADRIKKKQAAAFVVYTEALTPAEARDLFVKFAAEDAKTRVLDVIHVTPAQPADQRELKELFGFDPGPWKKSSPPDSGGKPISAGTGDMITKALTNPPGKPPEKAAVLLTFSPPAARTAPAASKELKAFADRRGERRPNTVPLVIVIRAGG